VSRGETVRAPEELRYKFGEALPPTVWKSMPDGPEKYQAYLCSREWSEKRQLVLKRCNGICERCGANPVAAVHHLTYTRKYAELPDDLAGWCRGCHDFTHGKSDADPYAQTRILLAAQRPIRLVGGLVVACPYCESENCHMNRPIWEIGNQGLAVFSMSCEGNHEWEMVLEGHKGTLSIFARHGRFADA
jgi:hypothetical protein